MMDVPLVEYRYSKYMWEEQVQQVQVRGAGPSVPVGGCIYLMLAVPLVEYRYSKYRWEEQDHLYQWEEYSGKDTARQALHIRHPGPLCKYIFFCVD